MKNIQPPLENLTGTKTEDTKPRRKSPNQPTKMVLAHEVRNPLTNINLAVGMLRSMNNSENQEIFLDIISRSSSKIEDLIRTFLTSIRDSPMNSGSHSIHNLLDEVVSSIQDRIVLKHITIKKEYDSQDCIIALNRPDMAIAFTNIIVNAIEAIRKEEGTLSIRTSSSEESFTIQIEDNGCGISEADLKNIFKPYFSNKPGGLGLGLAATLSILRSNHCTVNVISELNKGTCFEINIKGHGHSGDSKKRSLVKRP